MFFSTGRSSRPLSDERGSGSIHRPAKFAEKETRGNFSRTAHVSAFVRKAFPLLVVGLGLSTLVGLRAAPAAAADSADECVRLRESQEASGLSLSVDNNCDRRLSCTVTWTVQCESATGKIQKKNTETARFVISASQSQSAFASAKSCGDSWRVQDVSWDCAPLK